MTSTPPARAPWTILLAGGDGTRLRRFTADGAGRRVPKQFCSLAGGATLLEHSLDRVRSLARPEHGLVVVTEWQRAWWERDLAAHPRNNILVQPLNRGTGVAILTSLVELERRAPGATVVVMPSDHFVMDEETLRTAMARAVADVDRLPHSAVLLGIEPGVFDPDYGWIEPGPPLGEGLNSVAHFVEKPGRDAALDLACRGGVWNSFIIAARVDRLLELYRRLEPQLVALVRAVNGPVDLSPHEVLEGYQMLPTVDLSRDLLQRAPESLAVRMVPPCGWCDLGTADRVARCAHLVPPRGRRPPRSMPLRPVLTEAVLARLT